MDFDGDELLFENFVKWIYCGYIELTIENCVPLLVTSQNYKIPVLLSRTRAYIRYI